MYIPQKQLENAHKSIAVQKAVIIYGPRRCGKTTLLNKLVANAGEDYLFVNGEDISVQEYLESQSIEKLKSFLGKKKMLIIDEAQKIKNIGLNIKLILDNIPKVKVIASGSSSFDLAKQVGEPLTGRKTTLKMYSLAQLELSNIQSRVQIDACLEERLIYGSYPEVILNKNNAKNITYLREIVNSYLYKDILELERIRHSDKITRLLQLLAFQIGKEVSYNELSTKLGMSKNTIERYLDLLEKSFVVFKLRGFSRNLRKEITKNPRFYFYDTGVRNALINNFNSLTMRDDLGMLWENYIIIERFKKQEYLNINSNNYFWRTYNQKEIDLVEERKGRLFGYEIKWQNKKEKIPKEWEETYKNSNYQLITKENYLDFIT
ncbi:MAG: ATP-binding protein [Candidatus Omnitrophica bacterium]|nr:ATP-binding protein [Candidatus Omnitrophota bacterium]MCF7895273.1 ATP-binding protein [Candidatus Omnitrophota bacterium]